MNEFEIIQRYFRQADQLKHNNVLLGIGDDAAAVALPENHQLLVCMDTLVSGVHFPESTSAADIAYKSLAVNLSDMAAMGAEPHWITLSLTCPENDTDWFEDFAKGFHELADEYQLALIGGDLSRGPLSVTVELHGTLPKKVQPLKRSGAQPGDAIYVTGTLGSAAFALKSMLDKTANLPVATEAEQLRLKRPLPRLASGRLLLGKASSCIDISDGLRADLGHILEASQCGAEIQLESIPYSESLLKLDKNLAIELALTGGDDYELCFTLSASVQKEFIDKLNAICPVTQIGYINDSNTLTLIQENGEPYQLRSESYRHF